MSIVCHRLAYGETTIPEQVLDTTITTVLVNWVFAEGLPASGRGWPGPSPGPGTGRDPRRARYPASRW